MHPSVSIIIPLYNRETLVKQTLDSVRAQSLADWECVIVDDHSTDQSLEVCQQYAAGDGRFRVRKRSASLKGAPVCRNEGFRLATAEFVVFLDSDDVLKPNCLELRVRSLIHSKTAGFVVSPAELFENTPGDGELIFNLPTDEDEMDRFLRRDTPWLTSAVAWRRETVERLGGWDERLPRWQDLDWHLRALAAGTRFVWLPKSDSYYRKGAMDSGAISARPWAAADTRVLSEWLEKIQILLETSGCLNPVRRRNLASRYWLLARRAASSKFRGRRNFLSIWKLAWRGRLVSFQEWLTGSCLLGLAGWAPGSWLTSMARRRIRNWERCHGLERTESTYYKSLSVFNEWSDSVSSRGLFLDLEKVPSDKGVPGRTAAK